MQVIADVRISHRCDWLLAERLGVDNLVYPSSVDRLLGQPVSYLKGTGYGEG